MNGLDVDSIVAMADTGEGLLRTKGKMKLIHKGFVGDQYTEEGRLKVLSPVRRESPCLYSKTCDGCNWMDAGETFQHEQKMLRVVQALERLGSSLHPTFVPSLPLGYRRRARLVFDKQGVGFYKNKSNKISSINDCLALTPLLQQALACFNGMRHLFVGSGELNLIQNKGRFILLIKTNVAQPSAVYQKLQDAVKNNEQLHGVELHVEGVVQRWIKEGETALEAAVLGADGAWLHGPLEGFVQANESINRRMGEQLETWLDDGRLKRQSSGSVSALELYGGNGNFSMVMAKHVPTLVMESHATSVGYIEMNAFARGLHVDSKVMDADKVKLAELKPNILLLDPPRTGAASVAIQLKEKSPRQLHAVIYISCDVPTWKRDAQLMKEGGWNLSDVSVFDMFPQTHHVETMSLWLR